MAVRKIYTSINETQELEIKWSPFGIHLIISESDIESPTEFLIDKDDIIEFTHDIIEMHEDIINSDKDFSNQINDLLKDE